jgi:hypothetical protein
MPNNGREGKVAGRTLVATVAVFLLAFAFLVWGDSGTHIASNPGPSGAGINHNQSSSASSEWALRNDNRNSALALLSGIGGRY